MEQIVLGNIRVQLLSEDIVRVELGKKGAFEDRGTFIIPDRSGYADTRVDYTVEENGVFFGAYELYLPENRKSLSGVRLEKNGKKIYSFKRQNNSGELPALDKTPEAFAVYDTPRIVVPEGGYSAERRGEYSVDDRAQDVYLLLCCGDAKKLRRLYVELTGRSEMVRLSTLGGWNSKYYAYSEEEAKQLISDYEKYDVPLDVMVIDTDWRSCENGWGYDVNEKLFPDMKRFIDFAHARGVEIMFNDHPEPVNGAQVFAPEEIAYREKNLQAIMDLGLDIWWYDRNWVTKLVSPTAGVNCETLGMYLFSDITANYYRKKSGNKEVYRRPVIMANVDNIANGCYSQIYSSASHRYSIQWTGDIPSDPDSLAREVSSMIRAGNNAVAYINSDCGGHIGNPDKSGFIRWMQYGVLSPVFRPHCTNVVKRFREPWAYDGETLDIVREYNNLRYRLLPVIYKNAYNNYLTGEPIFKSLYYEYPDDKTALSRNDEYMLGNDLLIAPVIGINPVPVEAENYASPVRATFYAGRELKGEPIARAEWKELFMLLNHTSPCKGVPVYDFSARFETEVEFADDKALVISSDDGATVWVDGKKVHEDKTLHSAMMFPLCDIAGGKKHTVEIEYFQAGGEASCALFVKNVVKKAKTDVYFPDGRWVGLFDGRIYGGKSNAEIDCGLREMPLFVRAGAVLPLAYAAHNTREQKWDRLVLDYYSDNTACDEGYLYEDDGETTAYKLKKHRITRYSAGFENGAYIVRIEKSVGKFEGDRCVPSREVTVKRHLLGGARAARATVNGKPVEMLRAEISADAFPLGTGLGAPDGECESVVFTADADKAYEIAFFTE